MACDCVLCLPQLSCRKIKCIIIRVDDRDSVRTAFLANLLRRDSMEKSLDLCFWDSLRLLLSPRYTTGPIQGQLITPKCRLLIVGSSAIHAYFLAHQIHDEEVHEGKTTKKNGVRE